MNRRLMKGVLFPVLVLQTLGWIRVLSVTVAG